MGAAISACSGKVSNTTMILYHVNHGKKFDTIPALGMNKEVEHLDGMYFVLHDVGGLEKVRALWRTLSK